MLVKVFAVIIISFLAAIISLLSIASLAFSLIVFAKSADNSMLEFFEFISIVFAFTVPKLIFPSALNINLPSCQVSPRCTIPKTIS